MNFVQILRNVGKNGKTKQNPNSFNSNIFVFLVMILKLLMLKVFERAVKHFKNLPVEQKGKKNKKIYIQTFFCVIQ
jgi:hypothetical protein